MQTGDYFYLIKGYEEGDEVNADKEELEKVFTEILQDFTVSINSKSEDVSNYGEYLIAGVEAAKLNSITDIIDVLLNIEKRLVELGQDAEREENITIVSELLEGVKIERSNDLEKQKQILITKIRVHENKIEKLKKLIEKEENEEESENDIDRQFINVCLGLEIPFPDKKNISLYEFGIMFESLLRKAEELNKISDKK